MDGQNGVPQLPTRKKYQFTITVLFFSINSLLIVGVVVYHALLLVLAWVGGGWCYPDSIQYLTLAENVVTHGVWSQGYAHQSFLAPDFQRTPAYPFLLLMMGRNVLAVLTIQHILVLLNAWMVFVIASRYLPNRWAKGLGFAYAFLPYPALMASAVLSESFFLFLAIWAFYLLLRPHTYKYSVVLQAISIGIIIGALVLTKPIGVVFLITILLLGYYVIDITPKAFLVWGLTLCITSFLVVCPWLVRNAIHTGRITLGGTGQTAQWVGYLGGIAAIKHNMTTHDANLFRGADSIGTHQVPLCQLWRYPVGAEAQETAELNPLLIAYPHKFAIIEPESALKLHAKSAYQMLTGIGYGAALQATNNKIIAGLLAAVQGIVLVLWYSMVLFIFFQWLRRRWLLMWQVITICVLVLVFILALRSFTPWSDGRYWLMSYPYWIIMSIFAAKNWLNKAE